MFSTWQRIAKRERDWKVPSNLHNYEQARQQFT